MRAVKHVLRPLGIAGRGWISDRGIALSTLKELRAEIDAAK